MHVYTHGVYSLDSIWRKRKIEETKSDLASGITSRLKYYMPGSQENRGSHWEVMSKHNFIKIWGICKSKIRQFQRVKE